MNATENELEESGESCERWGGYGAGVVVLGVIAEVAIAAFHPPYDSFLEQWGSTFANSLVAFGIAVEVQFGRMGHRRQSELQRRSNDKVSAATKSAGEANERAAKAELELAKYRAWRALEGDAFASVVAAMKPFAGTPYTLAFSIAQPEITELMFQISAALTAAGLEWQGWPQTNAVRFPASGNAVTPGIGNGVNVRDVTITWELEPGIPPALARAGQTLSSALNAAEIVAGAWGEKQAPMTRPNPTLRVMVGLKT